MKWIHDPHSPSGHVLGLTPEEVNIIASELAPVISNLRKKYEKFLDIHESGEATEKQQDRLFYYQIKLELFESFVKQKS